MHHYHINHLDQHRKIFLRSPLKAEDDVSALEAAQKIPRSSPIEVWDSVRLIARVAIDGEAFH